MAEEGDEEDTAVVAGRVSAGQEQAIDQLVLRCAWRVALLARQLCRRYGLEDASEDSHGIANVVLARVIRALRDGPRPTFADRRVFWTYLRRVIRHEVLHERDRVHARRRGGDGRESAPAGDDEASGRTLTRVEVDFESFRERGPTPAEVVLGRLEAERLIALLGPPELRSIARLRHEGYRIDEIARLRRCGASSVRRKLRRIQELWRQAGVDPGPGRRPATPAED
jgi:DNA-directed RNA polymerase specialized sigma24 family protein